MDSIFEKTLQEARKTFLLDESLSTSNDDPQAKRDKEELDKVDKELTKEKLEHKKKVLNKYKRGEVDQAT